LTEQSLPQPLTEAARFQAWSLLPSHFPRGILGPARFAFTGPDQPRLPTAFINELRVARLGERYF
jgi:hypothetical protein